MHEVIAPLQVGLNVAGTLGIGGVVMVASNLVGRRVRGSIDSRRRAAARPLSTDYEPDVTIRDNRAAHRFEIRVDGELAGFLLYERTDDVVAFHHTEIRSSFRGRGLGERLIAFALDASRGEGILVEPHCPVVRGVIEKHSDYSDVVALVRTTRPERCCA
jgi:predicted GNAT family acetyltransferase